MKKIPCLLFLILPFIINAQTQFKLGGSVANRWNEGLSSQTMGKGFRFSAEKFLTPHLSTGLSFSNTSFNPTNAVNIIYSAVSFHYTYYLLTKTWQPYAGLGIGYNRYFDRTTIDLGNNLTIKQDRTKNYGLVSTFIGLKYKQEEKKIGLFFQINTEFVPISNIAPIGFIAATLGLITQL